MTRVLKLKRYNEKKELEFELKFLRSLSVKERFAMMVKKTKEIYLRMSCQHNYGMQKK